MDTINAAGKCTNLSNKSNTLKKWKLIANNQLQIDAGQKKFGGHLCKVCGMFYTLHEPEEEILHEKYHNSINILKFKVSDFIILQSKELYLKYISIFLKGWTDENLVCNVPEWESNGRIICSFETDKKQRRNRVNEILDVVDRDLGFAGISLKPQTIVSFNFYFS